MLMGTHGWHQIHAMYGSCSSYLSSYICIRYWYIGYIPHTPSLSQQLANCVFGLHRSHPCQIEGYHSGPSKQRPISASLFFVIFLVQSRGWFSFQRHEKVGRSWLYPPLMWGNCLAMVFSIKITFNHQNPLAKVTLFVLRHGKTRDLAKFQPRLLFLSVGSDHKRFTSIIHKGKRKMMPYGPTKSPNCQLFNHLHQLNNKKVFARMERAICNGALYL